MMASRRERRSVHGLQLFRFSRSAAFGFGRLAGNAVTALCIIAYGKREGVLAYGSPWASHEFPFLPRKVELSVPVQY